MAEPVIPSAAYEGDRRRQRVQKDVRARRCAAVVRRLQHAERRRWDAGDQLALDIATNVAWQHDRDVAVTQLEHDRVIVPDLTTLPVGLGWIPDLEGDARARPVLARTEHLPGALGSLRRGGQ